MKSKTDTVLLTLILLVVVLIGAYLVSNNSRRNPYPNDPFPTTPNPSPEPTPSKQPNTTQSNYSIIKGIFANYKNGAISECPTNGKMYYSAEQGAFDGGAVIFDSKGNSVGSMGGFSPANKQGFTDIDWNHCVRVYVAEKNIWGFPAVNKYNLQ